MYGTTSSPFAARGGSANLYAKVGLETDVLAANPHRLVSLLFDGANDAMGQAIQAIRNRDVELKTRQLQRAVRIFDEGLRAALDPAGGQVAADLRDLYAYICTRLTQANLRSDAAAIEECRRLLAPIQDAWQGIAGSPAAAPVAAQRAA
ncbi:MAG: flagellar export chaperone FliS [Roseateles sp.]|uniref:flagellar export chaperone FliS n=1 Tax=Roseateles sp. TaxID=1971397 RepID=UPI0039E7B484